jgi:hypothetical protein
MASASAQAIRVPDVSPSRPVRTEAKDSGTSESLDLTSLHITDDVHVADVVTSDSEHSRVTETSASATPLTQDESAKRSEGTTALQSREEVSKYKGNFDCSATPLTHDEKPRGQKEQPHCSPEKR